MSDLSVTSINLQNYGNRPSGNFGLSGNGSAMNFQMTDDEAREMVTLGLKFFERRQPEMAKSVADMKVPALVDLSAERR